jgi:glycerol-3-phosphate O-acyltransferase|tara:strand:+ start:710 stop:1849 length:1140 start_codon:yes stop_codon:yes gene_type:complete
MDTFAEIRPYNDDEIRPVLDKLIANTEFLDGVASFYAPRLSRFFPGFTQNAARSKLEKQLKDVSTVSAMQDVIAQYMDKIIEDTTTSLTHSGMENLKEGRAYLFMCNHRDITMDPAIVSYMLYQAGYETLQVAIGDNLLKKPFVSDLMRLNKSFIVKRSLKGRELLQALTLLSQYIHRCIQNRNNVWIAQREGRAKDGIDKTDPALLKMLAISQRKLPLSESLADLHIIPVAMSYEYDACDVLKAEELWELESTGSFTKTEKSDIQSIVTGMIGFKGDVHVAFGTELELSSDKPEKIAAEVDRQILQNYKLRDINFLALERLRQNGMIPLHQLSKEIDGIEIKKRSRKLFEKRLKSIDAKLHKQLLFSYANPVLGRYSG